MSELNDTMAKGGKKESSSSPFSDPVFKKISLKNGEINKMDYSELRKLAKSLRVCVKGQPEVLQKRVKSYYRKLYLSESEVTTKALSYPYYIVIDFEATCEDKPLTKYEYQHEIIEFPAVLVNSESLEIEDVFHEYVKPSKNKKLSEYCIALTGITQSQVNKASSFPQVLLRFEEWLQNHELIGKAAIVTDGPWDMARFLYMQVKMCHITYPTFAKRWVNIKKTFSNFYKQGKPTLDIMLSKLNFEFEGRRHNGLDDAKNISRVLIQMLKDGAHVRVNERIDLSSFQKSFIPHILQCVKPVTKDDFWNFELRMQKTVEDETTEQDSNPAEAKENSEDGVNVTDDFQSISLKDNATRLQ